MYAVVEAYGKQHRVKLGDKLNLERAEGEEGSKIKLDKILLFSDSKKINIGQPYLKNVVVNCEIIARIKDKKKIIFKYRRRKSSQTKRGHRQKLIQVEIKEIKHK